jgi:hypothetical protein
MTGTERRFCYQEMKAELLDEKEQLRDALAFPEITQSQSAIFRKRIENIDKAIELIDEEPPIETFTAKAQSVRVNGEDVVGVWTDGVMLSADNGKHAQFLLEKGEVYKVTVQRVKL